MTTVTTRIAALLTTLLLVPATQAQSPAENVHWDYRFGLLGPNVTKVVAGDGRVVAVGSFECLDSNGDLAACTFAIWDGTGWRFEAPTTDQPGLSVNAVALISNGIYIAGRFTSINGQPFNYIAFWNGTQWQPVGSGLNDVVFAIHAHPNGLYAGGQFTQAGGQRANRVAFWNGLTWEPLLDINTGNGVNNRVRAITSVGSAVYLGGDFSSAGGVTGANLVVQWNPTARTWTRLGTGLGYSGLSVYDLEMVAGQLFAAGNFTQNGDGTTQLPNVARFDGAAWVPVGQHPYGPILDLNGPYALYFSASGPPDAGDLAYWNGTAWGPVGNLKSIYNSFLASDASGLYASAYELADGRNLSGFGRWDGTRWQPVGQGVGSPLQLLEFNYVYALAYLNGRLYASGDFQQAGGERVRGLAQWDGTRWMSVGPADTDHTAGAHAMATGGGNLYVGTPLGNVGGVAAPGVARWDGNSWHALGSGLEGGHARALLFDGSDLYAGGGFHTAGGGAAPGVARWDGTAWHPLGVGLGGSIRAMVKHEGKLYVGGQFSTYGNATPFTNNVAVWDGAAWAALGPGLGEGFDAVRALTVYRGEVYAALDVQNGTGPARLYRWDGAAWVQVAEFTREDGNNDLFTLFANGDDLYIGGNFTTVNGAPIRRVARWDGTSWSGLGTGLPGPHGSVHAILGTPEGLWLGGNFSMAGDKPSHNIARWTNFSLVPTSAGAGDLPGRYALSAVHPNPFSERATVTLEVPEAQPVRVALYDVLGREVAVLHDGALTGAQTLTLDGASLPGGLYLLSVTGESFRETRRVVLVR